MTSEKNKTAVDYTRTFSDYLKRTGKRCTPERFFVLECAMQQQGQFDIGLIGKQLKDDCKYVSIATIYNTFDLLVDCGLLLRHRFDSGRNCLYELIGNSGRVHLICSRCGRVKELRDNNLATAILSNRYKAFTPSHFTLSVHGICSKCNRKVGVSKHRSSK